MMPENDPLLRLMQQVQDLQVEVARLGTQRPLFNIWNMSDVLSITATQNNYPLGDYDTVRMDPTANRTINGITGGVIGRLLVIYNNAANAASTLTFTHQNASADAANRIVTPTGASVVIAYRGTTILHYSNRWLMLYPAS